MKFSYLTTAALAAGLLIAAPVFAQSTTGTTTTTTAKPKPVKPVAAHVKKQKTDGEDVTGNGNFPAASGGAHKQHTEGEDVTGNNNFPAASK
jgi:hypothetical protein